jgi:hypothetical protein
MGNGPACSSEWIAFNPSLCFVSIQCGWLCLKVNYQALERKSAHAPADQGALQDVQQLPTPTVEQLLSAESGTVIVGACPVGDALTGTALIAATSDGKLHCLWPSSGQATDTVSCPAPKHDFQCGLLGEHATMRLHALQLVATLHSFVESYTAFERAQCRTSYQHDGGFWMSGMQWAHP